MRFILFSDITPCVNLAVDSLSNGGVIAVPTDTIYGLATNLESVNKLYDIKGRVQSKPVALCVGEIHDILKCFLFCIYFCNILSLFGIFVSF